MGWVSGWVCRWIDWLVGRWAHGWVGGWVGRRVGEWVNCLLGGWVSGWLAGWVGEVGCVGCCMHSSYEADTGAEKAFPYSCTKDWRQGPLAYTMGFAASSSGEGRLEPWLKEQDDARNKMKREAEAQAQAGSPSPQTDNIQPGNVQQPLQPRGTVAAQLKRERSPSPNKMRSSQWWKEQQQQEGTWEQSAGSRGSWQWQPGWSQWTSGSWWQSWDWWQQGKHQ